MSNPVVIEPSFADLMNAERELHRALHESGISSTAAVVNAVRNMIDLRIAAVVSLSGSGEPR